jgi:excisionase family DNA binding protein
MSGQLQTEELLTVSEVADILRVDSTTVRRWIKNGVLEALSLPHVGKRCAYRVKRSTINALLAGNQAQQEAA